MLDESGRGAGEPGRVRFVGSGGIAMVPASAIANSELRSFRIVVQKCNLPSTCI